MRAASFAFPLCLVVFLSAAASQAQQVPQADLEANPRMERDFLAYDPHYKEAKQQRIERIRAVAGEVLKNESAGQKTACSHQILFEAMSLIMSSADFKLIDRRLEDAEASLANPELQAKAEKPDPSDGSLGGCYLEWYLRVGASYDQLRKSRHDPNQQSPLPPWLDRIATPAKLTDYLVSISVSDISHTGIDHEREFNDMLAVLTRMLIRDSNIFVPAQLKTTLLDLIKNRLRNPKTGWWGESYSRNGHVDFVDDLSITFHLVSYLNGKVPDMDKVIDTTLAVKDMDYPVGWLWKGQPWNHNNMDVVTLFQYGWPVASDRQRKAMQAEIEKMLHWCLTGSLQPDGSFKPVIADGSLEESMEYGVAFLARIGFFDKSKRFWTNQDFPQAEEVRARIMAFVKKHEASGGAGGTQYQGVLEDLNESPEKQKQKQKKSGD
jgi:hypothetical protein